MTIDRGMQYQPLLGRRHRLRVRGLAWSDALARLVDPDGALNPEMQRVYKFLGKEYDVPRKILELNPSHSILKSLLKLAPGSDLDKLIIEQIYDNALLAEGLHPDPAGMAPRLQQLMEAALKGGA